MSEQELSPVELELKALEKELEAEKDALREAEAAREVARRPEALRAEIEAVRRKCKEEAVLASLEAKHGLLGVKISRVDSPMGMIIIRRADGIKVRKWQDENSEKITSDALRELGRPCVLYPELADFDAIVSDCPVVMTAVASEVLKLAGLKLKEIGGK